MEKNKTGKYLKYAVGEIVLVVIGILIALTINNWNEHRKDDVVLHNYLQLIVEELQQDMSFNNSLILENNVKLKYLIALSNGNYESLNLENAQTMISYNLNVRNFGSSYITLKQNGKIIGINNKKLRDLLIYYYEDLTVEYNQYTEWHRNFVIANIEDYTTEHIPIDLDGNSKPSMVIEEMQHNKLTSLVNFQIDIFRGFDTIAKDNNKTIVVLIEELKNEITEAN